MNNAIAIYSNQTLAVGTEVDAGAVCVDCSADTSYFASLEIALTNGSTPPGAGRTVTCYYAWVSTQLTGSISNQARSAAEKFNVTCDSTASSTVYFKQDTTKRGKYLCFWYDHRPLNTAVTLNVKLLY